MLINQIAKYILAHNREALLVPTDDDFALAETLLGRDMTESEENHFVGAFGDLQIPD